MKNFYVPSEFKGRTGYQIFVDRFFRGGTQISPIMERRLKNWNDAMPDWKPGEDGEYRNEYFYGGDLLGIIQKLDYLKSMGFNLIYLNPISQTHTNHHYDVEDQRIIDPYIGTCSDFKKLCDEAHRREILICVDLVFNHIGAKSKVFQEALKGNPKYVRWFEWDNGKPVYWYDFHDLPQTNKHNQEFLEYASDVAKTYVKNGADGIRLDLGEILPPEFLRKLRDFVKKINPEVLIVSEMWGFDSHREFSQLDGTQVDSVMNYPLSDAILRWTRWGNNLHIQYTLSELAKYPESVKDVLWNFLDSHDTPRALTMLEGEGMCQDPIQGKSIWDIEEPWRYPNWFDTYGFREWEFEHDAIDMRQAIPLLKQASLQQYIMKGIPIVYYGTEAGLYGHKDPFNRKPYPWDNLNHELLDYYKKIGQMRNDFMDIFATGTQKQYYTPETAKIVRTHNGKSIITLMNRTNHEVRVSDIDSSGAEILNINNCSKKVLSPRGSLVMYYG